MYLPDGTNGDAAIPAYEPDADTVYSVVASNNVALIRLENTLVLDGSKQTFLKLNVVLTFKYLNLEKIQRAAIAPFTDVDDFMSKVSNYRYRACGVGVIGNYGQKPKGVVCTDVNPIGASCGDDVITPDNAVCLQWTDRDNNICVGKLTESC